MDGSFGDDSYYYKKGDGNDVIDDYYGNNHLVFMDINSDEVSISHVDGSDAVLTISSTGETITIDSQFSWDSINTITFADGTEWNSEDLKNSIWITGTDGDDNLIGSSDDDRIMGNKGDDTLEGYIGDDSYYYKKGDGNDVIDDYYGNNHLVFMDINSDEVSISRVDGSDAVLTISSTGETITIDNQFFWDNINTITFADDVTWDNTDLAELAWNGEDLQNNIWITGTDGDDDLSGSSDDDWIMGNKGDDVLFGSFGDDSYYYKKGDGNDVIDDYSGNNNLVFMDINSDEVSISRVDGSDAVLTISSTGETITIDNHFFWDSINTITFADDVTWNNTDLADLAWIIGTDDSDYLNGSMDDDRIDGGAGDDTISSSLGDDILNGGTGNDSLSGSLGNDIFVFADNFGHDVIEDFDDGDVIEFADNTFNSYAEVVEAIVEDGNNVTIEMDSDNSVSIENISAAELQPDDFNFV